MRSAPIMIAIALIVTACAGAPVALAPSVSIDSVDVSGAEVSIIVSTGEGDSVLLSVAWGDGTAEPDVEGVGTFAFQHTYGADVTSATISVAATASDGSVASDVAAVDLNGDTTTTSLVAIETTTTAVVTTTLPPTTTTLPVTTTTRPPTTTTSSTTTTIPLPETIEVELAISKGKIFDRWGSGTRQTTWNGRTATATVTRHKKSWESDGIAIAFAIPASSYEALKRGASSLRFEFIAYPLVEFTLDTDKLDGNAAEVKWQFMGTYDTTWSGNAKIVDIGAGFLTKGKNGEPFESSWALDKRDFGVPQTVYAFFQCRAHGPGGILVTSDSKCDASLDVNGITVTVTANR